VEETRASIGAQAEPQTDAWWVACSKSRIPKSGKAKKKGKEKPNSFLLFVSHQQHPSP
jgi:hypothetical protein